MSNFYVTRKLPYDVYEDVQHILIHWEIWLMAIEQQSTESMSDQDHTNLRTREDAEFLFLVHGVPDLDMAGQILDEMLEELEEEAEGEGDDTPSEPVERYDQEAYPLSDDTAWGSF